MSIANAPKPPENLSVSGRKLWKQVVSKYQLRADELRTLEDACAATDMVQMFTQSWLDLGQPLISKGSMGQEVEHPLIGSIDKQRKARQAFLRQLKLPDDPSGAGQVNQNRAAGQSRWAAAHGGAGA